jgi:hypothetical protein
MQHDAFKFNGKELDRGQVIQAAIISGGFLGCTHTLIRLKFMEDGRTKYMDKYFDNESAAERKLDEIRRELDFMSISDSEIYNSDHYLGMKHETDFRGNYVITIFMTLESIVETFSSPQAALDFYSGLPDNFTNQSSLPGLRR